MQSSHQYSSSSRIPNSLDPSSFSPFVIKTLEIEAGFGFAYESACYDPKYNMIIACPVGFGIHFYDATTFEPCKKRPFLNVNSPVSQIRLQRESDTYLLGTGSGLLYKYRASQHHLSNLKNLGQHLQRITWLNANFYAFSLLNSNRIYVGNLDHDNLASFDLNHSDCTSLYFSMKRNLLFCGLSNGFVRIYCTKKLPDLRVMSSIQAHKAGKRVLSVQGISLNGREYFITASEDWSLRIWHFTREKMRLIRVVYPQSLPHSVLYLENYKMIVVASDSDCIRFFRFPSMKLAKVVNLSGSGKHYLFLMKDRNLIGATHLTRSLIEFIQIRPG